MMYPALAGATPARTPLPQTQAAIGRKAESKANLATRLQGLLRQLWILLAFTLLPAARPLAGLQPPNNNATMATLPEVLCTLPAPSYCTADRTGPSTASVEWGAVQYAASYQIKVYEQGTDQLISSNEVHGTATSLTGLQSGQAYYCTVAAICSGGSVSDFVIIEEIAF